MALRRRPGGFPYRLRRVLQATGPIVLGTAAITESADTAAGVGTDRVNGTSAITEPADTASGVGTASVFGISAIAEPADTAAGVGTGNVAGVASIAEGADAAAGAGTGVPLTPGGGSSRRRGALWEPSVSFVIAEARERRRLEDLKGKEAALVASGVVRLEQQGKVSVATGAAVTATLKRLRAAQQQCTARLARLAQEKARAESESRAIATRKLLEQQAGARREDDDIAAALWMIANDISTEPNETIEEAQAAAALVALLGRLY